MSGVKRPRTSVACQNCRARKLSCTGDRPCARCQQDGRECIDADAPERTPLTRQRMTQLEERLTEFERLWHALHPQLPLQDVRARLASVGLEAAVGEISVTQQSSTLPRGLNQHERAKRDISDGHPRDYPPTRPASPCALSLGLVYEIETAQGASSEWKEVESPNDVPIPNGPGATPSNDFGTGVRGGAGYMGLSSAATLLRAIQKFAPLNTSPLTQQPASGFTTISVSTPQISQRGVPVTEFEGGDVSEVNLLPPISEIGPLVDCYFRYFHALHPVVHEPTVRAQLTGALPLPTSSGSRVLFNMIFATGAFDSAIDDSSERDGSQYYEVARGALQEDLFAEGSLVLVQGLAIMALYLQRCNKPNAGYVCLGLAIRMAMALGIHVSIPISSNVGMTVLESETRSRIWWVLVTLEAGMCMTYGRPHGICLPSLSAVRIPVNVEDERLTVSSTTQPSDTTQVTRYTALIIQARLAQIAFHSLDRISRSLPSPTVEQVKWCGDYFRDRYAALPAYMRSPAPPPYRLACAIQAWRARDYRSVLYRPVFLSAAWSESGLGALDDSVCEIVGTCRTLALENLRDIADFIRTTPDPHRGSEWYTLYFGIQASLTILLSIVWEPHHRLATTWRTHIVETITWLRQLHSIKKLGTAYADIMEDVLSTRSGPLHDSTEPFQHAVHRSENIPSDIDTFDFERFFTEIWDGQPQMPAVSGDLYFGMGTDSWDGIFTNSGA